MTRIRPALAAAAIAAAALPAAAQQAPSPTDLKVYAAFAKLEANIAESTLLVTTAALLDDAQSADRARMAEEYANDSAQVADYVRVLGAADLAGEDRAALTDFEAKWAEITTVGQAMLEGDMSAADYKAQVIEYWELVDGVDDAIDDTLEAMRRRFGADWDQHSS